MTGEPAVSREGAKMTCTWKECDKEALHQQTDRGGRQWACLCDQHHKELDAALEALDAKKMMRAWVLASGGAKKMAGSANA